MIKINRRSLAMLALAGLGAVSFAASADALIGSETPEPTLATITTVTTVPVVEDVCTQVMADGSTFCGAHDIDVPAPVIDLPAPPPDGVPTADGLVEPLLQAEVDMVAVPVEDGLTMETGEAEASVASEPRPEDYNASLTARYCEIKPDAC